MHSLVQSVKGAGTNTLACAVAIVTLLILHDQGRALLGREPARSCLVARAHAAFGVAGLGGVVGSVRVRRSDWGCWLVRPVWPASGGLAVFWQ